MSAMDRQVGGGHYVQHKIQPWDIWQEYKLNPWEADVVKRILRRKGDRVEDLQKIIHCCEMLIELEPKTIAMALEEQISDNF